MLINKNLAKAMRRYKEERCLSIMELSEELGITKSMTELYISGNGNPRSDTLELLAERMDVPLVELVAGLSPGTEQAKAIAHAAKEIRSLPAEQREEAVQLFLRLADLFSREDDT